MGLEVGHQERRGHALSAHIGDGDGHASVGEAHSIVIVPAHVMVWAIPGGKAPVVILRQHPGEQHGLHLPGQLQLPLDSGRPDAFGRQLPVPEGDDEHIGQGRDEADVADGRAHAPAFLPIAHHHIGDDLLFVLHGNGEVELHLGVAGDDGMGLATKGRVGIVQTGQLGGVAPFHGTRPGAVTEVAAEQGELADAEGI